MVQIHSVIPDSIMISTALPCPIRRMAIEREAGPHRKESFSDASGLAKEGGAGATVEELKAYWQRGTPGIYCGYTRDLSITARRIPLILVE